MVTIDYSSLTAPGVIVTVVRGMASGDSSSSTPTLDDIDDCVTVRAVDRRNIYGSSGGTEQSVSSPENVENDNQLERKKRAKTSVMWSEFTEVVLPGGIRKGECIHCKTKLKITTSGSTTQFNRHLKRCVKRIAHLRQQQINFPPSNSQGGSNVLPALRGQFSMLKMREFIAHWVLMHEHPFSIVEEEGLNNMMKYGIPEWTLISLNTCKNDCMKVFESERQKLLTLLKGIRKISLTTDLWHSGNQRMEYMVLTGHWIDDHWKFNRQVLNFIHFPPPRSGVAIADAIFKCLMDWGIEAKVHTISVDNASSNDVAVKVLKDNFQAMGKLICGGKMFHIRYIIEDICDTVSYINSSESRLKVFVEIVQQRRLPFCKLILDCKTRWNSTYDMLTTAMQFRRVFPCLKERDLSYQYCPKEEDWDKVEKICPILKVFSAASNLISGSDYPTSNLFLKQVCTIKIMLDSKSRDGDQFIQTMIWKMKEKFDKYWGECNLLMGVAAILDPRLKMRVIEWAFPKMYPQAESRANVDVVRDALYEVYREYVDASKASTVARASASTGGAIQEVGEGSGAAAEMADNWDDFSEYLDVVEMVEPTKSELDCYLGEGCHKCVGDATTFDALTWWKANSTKFPILSTMTRDILAIPITTVASESTFSAGSRVIDTYRSLLAPNMVEMLLCGCDWSRTLNGVKKGCKEEQQPLEINLPIP
ncbi:zinc finger BED domain-containing protein RICESLEEPER 2-like [Pistacia vera]|uniref:zinc finger BED domain-containing protein RICESLEEPER 2-like n=1 Tax=Pistacia vera TaxID=55513 RepID=UPI001262FE6E|nr:zinc finger BED domain-containing protein RICESLEEPER 2-like [Pistacia vera]